VKAVESFVLVYLEYSGVVLEKTYDELESEDGMFLQKSPVFSGVQVCLRDVSACVIDPSVYLISLSTPKSGTK